MIFFLWGPILFYVFVVFHDCLMIFCFFYDCFGFLKYFVIFFGQFDAT